MEHDLPRLTNRIANCSLPLPPPLAVLNPLLAGRANLCSPCAANDKTQHRCLPTSYSFFLAFFFWRISGQEATATAAASAVSQVAATCGTCCVVQSRQEKRSRNERKRRKKKKMSGACAGVRERKTRSERERGRGEQGAITQMFRYTFCGLFCSLATQISGPTVTQAGQRCQVLFTLALSISPSPSAPLSLCLSPLKVKSLPKCEVATLASASSSS